MPTQAFPYLVLTDATTTITIQDGSGGQTSYALIRSTWAPAVTGLRRSALGGRGPYEDVVEMLVLNIYGATAAAAMANVATLARLLEQAERWARGENVAVVLAKLAPQGSTVAATATPYQAAVLGRAAGDQTAGVELSAQWDQVGQAFVVPAVRVRFVRHGLWLLAEDSAASSGTDNGDLATITLSSAASDPSPTRLSITNYLWARAGQAVQARSNGGFLLLTDGATDLKILDTDLGDTGVLWIKTSDAAKKPYGGTYVLRYTPTGTTESASSANLVVSGLNSAAERVGVFANLRNNSNSTSFRLRAWVKSYVWNHTPQVVIPAYGSDGAYPAWVYLGAVSARGALASVQLRATASAAAGSLDCDCIVLANLTNPLTQVVALLPETNQDGSSGTLAVDHQLLTKPNGAVLAATNYPLSYRGDIALHTRAANLYGLLLATGGVGGYDYWRQWDGTSALFSNAWTGVRRPGALVPA